MKVYIQDPFSGSSIRSRYANNNSKNESESQEKYDDDEEDEEFTDQNNNGESIRPQPKKITEEDMVKISLMMGEEPDAFQFYSIINPKSISILPGKMPILDNLNY